MQKVSVFLKFFCVVLLVFFVIFEIVLILYLCKDIVNFAYFYLCTIIYLIVLLSHYGFYRVYLAIERLDDKLEQNRKD